MQNAQAAGRVAYGAAGLVGFHPKPWGRVSGWDCAQGSASNIGLRDTRGPPQSSATKRSGA
jgi:hypothetical protein